MDGHERGADQANHMFGHRPDHLLAPLTTNQFGFAFLFSHGGVPFREGSPVQHKRQGNAGLIANGIAIL